MPLRDYQQAAVDSVLQWVRKTTAPCVVEAPTGAGKSHIIAAVCDELFSISKGKRVLVIAPSAELVVQDHEKYVYGVGQPASFFSASVGQKSVRHPVVFGTPGTVKGALELFDDRYCAVIIDEAHRVTPTLKGIVSSMREHNPNLRVIGLTATPYRMGTGYIYRSDETGRAYGEEQAREPYFERRVYTISARMLIDRGYLTPPVSEVAEAQYDTSELEVSRMGTFTSESVERAFFGQTVTHQIVHQVLRMSESRRGVMFFAASIAHAREILGLLPSDKSALVTGETKKADRKRILSEFKAERLKYLVNVDVLTTGFDAPHVDVIAVLRATESASLLQQIIGRGLRICEGKTECLVLDYAGNVERHCPDGDLFAPEIKTRKTDGGDREEVTCPSCAAINLFVVNAEACALGQMDAFGYVCDLTGSRIESEWGPTPGHYGRRCNGHIQVGPEFVRCSYRWTYKECPECEAENDISARKCHACKVALVDPNDKLRRDFAKYKRDPKNIQCDVVTRWVSAEHVGAKGNECLRVRVSTPYRTFTAYLFYGHKVTEEVARAIKLYGRPRTVTYQKRGDFYRILAVNQQEDINEST